MENKSLDVIKEEMIGKLRKLRDDIDNTINNIDKADTTLEVIQAMANSKVMNKESEKW